MAVELVMPRLGWTMEEGVFREWLKHDGDAVQAGDLLYTVESDKAVNEVEALDSGILRIPPDAATPGTTLPVGAVLGYLVQPGERAPFEQAGDSPPAAGLVPPPKTIASAHSAGGPRSAAPDRARKNGAPAISPRARRIAAELHVDWAALQGSGRSGRIVERDVRAVAARPPALAEPRATPLARRVAADLGVDLEQLAAEMPGQRIERAHVEQAAAPAPAAEPDQALAVTGVRRIVAQRMAESARTAAPVTLTTEADATELARLRQQIAADLQDSGAPVPSYNDLLAKLVAVALIEHPALNASWAEDRIVQHAAVHIGIAVDAERGLLAPVVRDVQRKSIQQIAADSGRLIAQARAGTAAPDDLRGGTFTITNLGMYEIDAFTPIINLPECAILGVGRIVARPVVIDEQAETIAVRKMMALSLTFDHRVVDGAPAARFLRRVKQFVEHPYLWLTR